MRPVMEIVHLFAHRAALTAGTATILVLLCTQIQASTTDAELKETSVVEQSVKNPKKRSCRKVKVTGRHIKQRVCMSNARWSELEEQQELARLKARAASNDPTNAVN